MRKIMIAAAALAAATPAVAQVDVGGGLVDVTIQNVDVLNNFLNDSQVGILENVAVGTVVQVPIGVAANVCGIAANVLAADLKQDGKATCGATSGSEALTQAAIRQHASKKKN